MKKALLIIGIIIIAIGVLAVLIGILIGYIRTHTVDGSSSLYDKQKRAMIIHLITGAVAVIVGIICLVVRSKKL